MDYQKIKQAKLILRALDNPFRVTLLKLLQTKKLSVTEIYVKLRWEQSVASQHLAILRRAGFVNVEKDGKHKYYTVNEQNCERIEHLCGKMIDVARASRELATV
jgi:ArsR family transcriptional regulator, virulence genes transcriptional regulator